MVNRDHECKVEWVHPLSGYAARCSCGWTGARTFTTVVQAHAAIRDHRKAVLANGA